MKPGADRVNDDGEFADDVDTCIVVPCFNEATRLPPQAFDAYLADNRTVGFLFVDDGSADATADVLEAICARHVGRSMFRKLPQNCGKAEAVRVGLQAALAVDNVEFAGYWDADLSTPLNEIDRLRAVFESHPGVDIVIGVRLPLRGHRIERGRLRASLGKLFARAVSIPFGRSFHDTQCGAKIFRVTSGLRAAIGEPFLSRWIFDVELLSRCRSVDGPPGDRYSGIYEQPLDEWVPHGSSKVGPWAYGRALLDVPRVWYHVARHRNG
jgi:dolichyl-phosphate beta-glucosyltransferase